MAKIPDLRQLLVPAYIFLCIVLGGSAQAIWGRLTLQLFALLLIGWAAACPASPVQNVRFRVLGVLALALLGLMLAQLIPLPPGIWTNLPGRETLVRGYLHLGYPLPWLPLSMAPASTLACVIFLLPPLAVVVAVVVLDACRIPWAVAAILAGTVLSVLLGYAQVSSKSASLYLYEDTNFGSAVGFFANRNHMGTLLLVSIPFTALFLSGAISSDRRKSMPIWITGISCGIFILAGIAMNGSLAALVLAVPVTTASMLLFPSSRRLRTAAVVVSACALMASLALLADSPVQDKLTGAQTSSISGRWEIWTTSLHAATAALPIGTGFGSFVQVYHLFEDPFTVTDTFVIHAHNDYLEWALEGGVPAMLLIAAFFWWWAAAARAAWSDQGDKVRRAATIASAAVLCHSAFDYPLRTTAIATIFAFSVALMVAPAIRTRSSEPEAAVADDWRKARHVTIG
jgi:O-antigen ligase